MALSNEGKRWVVDCDGDTWWEVDEDSWKLGTSYSAAVEATSVVRGGRSLENLRRAYGIDRVGTGPSPSSNSLIGPDAGLSNKYRIGSVEYETFEQAVHARDVLFRHDPEGEYSISRAEKAGARTPFYAHEYTIYDADGVVVGNIAPPRSDEVRPQLAQELADIVNKHFEFRVSDYVTVGPSEGFRLTTVNRVDDIPSGAVAFRTSTGKYAVRGTPSRWWWVGEELENGHFREEGSFDLRNAGHSARDADGPLRLYYSASQAPYYIRPYIRGEKTRPGRS